MSALTAVFRGVDEISSIFDRMANAGQQAMDRFDSVSETVSRAFSRSADGAEEVAKAVQTATEMTGQLSAAVNALDGGNLDSVAAGAESVAGSILTASDSADALTSAIGSVSGAAFDQAATSVDSVASSVQSAADSAGNWTAAIDQFDSGVLEQAAASTENVSRATQEAAVSTEYWTAKLGNYDKTMMEAVYTTAELVEQGYKAQTALDVEAEAARLCAQASDYLTKATSAAVDIHEEMAQVSMDAARAMEQVADNDRVATNTKEELSRASEAVSQAAVELTAAQEEAALATEALARAMSSASTSQADMEKAAERAAHASEALAAANDKATKSTGELSAAVSKATGEHEKLGKSGGEAVKGLEQAFVAAGLTKLVSEVTGAVIELANEFSNAESVIVKATGATGAALDGLSNSMMNVYSVSKTGDLSAIAGAIGEVNTRLGLTGPELDHVTGLFMDYSRITGADAVGSVQSLTKVMKNWGVETQDTERLMDMFSYAAQASGASVDQLSNMVVENKATFQALGYGIEESIGLLSMFELEGINAGAAMTGMRNALNQFTEAGLDASVAMQENIAEIANMVDAHEAGALASELFGKKAGPEMALAIRTGRFEVDQWAEAIGNSQGTLAKTAEASTTLEEKWTQASNKMSAAFSNTLSPAVNGISSFFAGLVGGIGDLLDKCPPLTAAITGIGVVLGLVAVGIAAYNAALLAKNLIEPIATALTGAFGVTLSAAIWPITLIVAAIAALVAGIAMLIGWLGSVDEEWASLSATSRQHYEEVERLNDEYERAAACAETTAEELAKLEAELEAATAVYEANRLSMEELTAQHEKLIDAHRRSIDSLNDSMEAIGAEEKSTTALISKLGELSSKTTLTAAEQKQMSAITDKLNKQMPELALAVDKETGALIGNLDVTRELIAAQADRQREAAQNQAMLEALEQETDLYENLMLMNEQLAAASDNKHGWGWFGKSKESHKQFEELKEMQEAAQAAYDENQRMLEDFDRAANEAARAAEEAARAMVGYEDAVGRAVQSVSEDLAALVESYDKAYEAARNSLDGTFKLFEKVEEKAGISSEAIIDAWQSQIDFFNEYNENLAALQGFDLDPKFLSKLSDGSQESAAQVKALMDEIGSMDPGEAAKRISEINDKFGELSEAKDSVAGTMAEIQTDFSNELEKIVGDMEQAVVDLNMDDLAKESARETMREYIDTIKSMTSEAHSAFAGVAAGAELLSGKGVTVGVPITGGFATGTDYAPPGLALVGEDGPELVNFQGGERVYPADETSRMMSAAAEQAQISLSALSVNAPDLAPVNLAAPNITAPNLSPINLTVPDVSVPNLGVISLSAPEIAALALSAPEVNMPSVQPVNLAAPDVSVTDPAPVNIGVVNIAAPDVAVPDLAPINFDAPGVVASELDSLNFNAPGVRASEFADITLSAPSVSVMDFDPVTLNAPEIDGDGIIHLRDSAPLDIPDDSAKRGGYAPEDDHTVIEHRYTLDINGAGEIQIDGSISKEGVLEILMDNLKPVLIGIVEQEAFEEGNDSYDF